MSSKPFVPHGMQRVFIGIPIDTSSQQHINRLLAPFIRERQDIRWVAEKNRHMTLAFLGNQPDCVVEKLVRIFDETYHEEAPFQFCLSALTRFPNTTGRIIALIGELTEPIIDLFQVTLSVLQKNKLESDRKAFRPHVTLGRLSKGKQPRTSFEQPANINLQVTEVRLYKSTLTDSGITYSALKTSRLD